MIPIYRYRYRYRYISVSVKSIGLSLFVSLFSSFSFSVHFPFFLLKNLNTIFSFKSVSQYYKTDVCIVWVLVLNWLCCRELSIILILTRWANPSIVNIYCCWVVRRVRNLVFRGLEMSIIIYLIFRCRGLRPKLIAKYLCWLALFQIICLQAFQLEYECSMIYVYLLAVILLLFH